MASHLRDANLAQDDQTLIERMRRSRDDPALVVLEGLHPLKHALRFDAQIHGAWTADRDALMALAARLAPDVADRLRAVLRTVTPAVFERLARVPPETGVIALAERPQVEMTPVLTAPAAPLVLLDNPSHLGNVGAVVRAAAAAGAGAVLTMGRQDPWHPAALRGSAGLHFALPVARLDRLPVTDRPIVAIHPEGEILRPGAIPDNAVLAFGTERWGLGRALLERADRRLAIPMRPGVSSLNLATAVAIVLYAWRLAGNLP